MSCQLQTDYDNDPSKCYTAKSHSMNQQLSHSATGLSHLTSVVNHGAVHHRKTDDRAETKTSTDWDEQVHLKVTQVTLCGPEDDVSIMSNATKIDVLIFLTCMDMWSQLKTLQTVKTIESYTCRY